MPVVLPLEGTYTDSFPLMPRLSPSIAHERINSHRMAFFVGYVDRALGCLDGVCSETRYSAYTYHKPVSRENIILPIRIRVSYTETQINSQVQIYLVAPRTPSSPSSFSRVRLTLAFPWMLLCLWQSAVKLSKKHSRNGVWRFFSHHSMIIAHVDAHAHGSCLRLHTHNSLSSPIIITTHNTIYIQIQYTLAGSWGMLVCFQA